jgi:hypothetical protein
VTLAEAHVAPNQIARIQFLQASIQGGHRNAEDCERSDPENMQMHCTPMLCYRGLGNGTAAECEEKLFRRQAVHDRESITLTEEK